MIHTLKKIDQNQTELIVELDRNDLKSYIDKTELELGKDFQLDGFRKGKAPKDLLKKNLDAKQVLEFALDMAMKDSLAQITGKEKLDVLNVSKIEVKENTADKLVYKVTLTLFPEIKIQDFSKFKVATRAVQAEQKDVDETLETIKASRSILRDKDGTVQNGDRVEVDFEVRHDGQILEGGISKNHPLIIGGRGFIPGFEEQLVGMKKEETKNFSLTAPADYFYKEIAGKKLDFSVKLNEIKRVIRPEINDDFAKSLGHFANVLELKENIKIGLAQEKNTKERQKLRLQILDNIISQSKIEVPDNLLSKQLDVMISDFDHTLHDKGMELGLYLAKIGKTQEELKKDWIKEAEKQAKISIVLRKIAKDRRLNATQEEVEEMANQVIQAAIMRGEVGQNDVDPVQIKENVTSRIINEKTLNYIESQCAV